MRPSTLSLGILALLQAMPTLAAAGVPATRPAKPTTSVVLPAPRTDGGMGLDRALATRRSQRALTGPISLAAVSQLLWAAQGVTGPRGQRTAPSAHAAYPLEIYLVAGDVTELPAGTYRYVPATHRLELLSAGDRRSWLIPFVVMQAWVAAAPAIVVIATDASRLPESKWRYLEVGLAAENLLLEAVSQGLGSTFVGSFDAAGILKTLVLPATVEPAAVLPVGKPR